MTKLVEEIEYADGEIVSAIQRQFNDEGKCISEAKVTWFGMDNAGANEMSIGLAQGVTDIADAWSKIKKEGRRLGE